MDFTISSLLYVALHALHLMHDTSRIDCIRALHHFTCCLDVWVVISCIFQTDCIMHYLYIRDFPKSCFFSIVTYWVYFFFLRERMSMRNCEGQFVVRIVVLVFRVDIRLD